MQAFHEKSNIWRSSLGQKYATSKSANDVGTFVAKLGEENVNRFVSDMTTMFPSARCGAKTNVQRIAQKIEEIGRE